VREPFGHQHQRRPLIAFVLAEALCFTSCASIAIQASLRSRKGHREKHPTPRRKREQHACSRRRGSCRSREAILHEHGCQASLGAPWSLPRHDAHRAELARAAAPSDRTDAVAPLPADRPAADAPRGLPGRSPPSVRAASSLLFPPSPGRDEPRAPRTQRQRRSVARGHDGPASRKITWDSPPASLVANQPAPGRTTEQAAPFPTTTVKTRTACFHSRSRESPGRGSDGAHEGRSLTPRRTTCLAAHRESDGHSTVTQGPLAKRVPAVRQGGHHRRRPCPRSRG